MLEIYLTNAKSIYWIRLQKHKTPEPATEFIENEITDKIVKPKPTTDENARNTEYIVGPPNQKEKNTKWIKRSIMKMDHLKIFKTLNDSTILNIRFVWLYIERYIVVKETLGILVEVANEDDKTEMKIINTPLRSFISKINNTLTENAGKNVSIVMQIYNLLEDYHNL